MVASGEHPAKIAPGCTGKLPLFHVLRGKDRMALKGLTSVTDIAGHSEGHIYMTSHSQMLQNFSLSVSTAIFPGGPGLTGNKMSLFRILLELRMMEVVRWQLEL